MVEKKKHACNWIFSPLDCDVILSYTKQNNWLKIL